MYFKYGEAGGGGISPSSDGKMVKIIYALFDGWRGRGLSLPLIMGLIERAVGTSNRVEMVYASIDDGNVLSQKAVLACGFKRVETWSAMGRGFYQFNVIK